MKIDVENINQFINEFEYKVFPTIKGSDGNGIQRLKEIVEMKRIEVAKRKIKRLKAEIYEEIANKPRKVNNNSIDNIKDYQKINLKPDSYKIDIKFGLNISTNEMHVEGFINGAESAHIVSRVKPTYTETKYNIA